MAYTIKRDIVVPSGYVPAASGYVKPFRQSHAHSTGNPTASVQNERDYLAGHYQSANYTHLVGITNGKVDIRQVAEVNQGAWDFGGDWNAETFGAVEFAEGSIKSQSDFNKAYPAYVWLLRKLLADLGGKDYTLDTSNIMGIKTHNYASLTGHGSDHVDPVPFLEKWGVSYNQFKSDIKNGLEPKPKKEAIELRANIKGATYKQGDKVTLVKGGQSAYGTPFTPAALGTFGVVSAVRPITASEKKKHSKSGFVYLVGMHYKNNISYWNVPGQYLKHAK